VSYECLAQKPGDKAGRAGSPLGRRRAPLAGAREGVGGVLTPPSTHALPPGLREGVCPRPAAGHVQDARAPALLTHPPTPTLLPLPPLPTRQTPYPRYGDARRKSYYDAANATCERFDETGAAPADACGGGRFGAPPAPTEWAAQVCVAKAAYEALLVTTRNATLASVAATEAAGEVTSRRDAAREVDRLRAQGRVAFRTRGGNGTAARRAGGGNGTAPSRHDAARALPTPNDAARLLRRLLQAPGNDVGLCASRAGCCAGSFLAAAFSGHRLRRLHMRAAPAPLRPTPPPPPQTSRSSTPPSAAPPLAASPSTPRWCRSPPRCCCGAANSQPTSPA
jgi:hypothetical protein